MSVHDRYYRISGYCVLTVLCFFTLEPIDSTTEANLVVQALRINTLSKLTFVDSKRFDALVKDVFPGVEFRDIEYEHLAKAIEQACEEDNLIVNKNQVWVS